MRHDATIQVTCDGNGCEKRKGHLYTRNFARIELTGLGNGDWSEGTVDASLKAEGWTKDGEKDLCPECSKEADNA